MNGATKKIIGTALNILDIREKIILMREQKNQQMQQEFLREREVDFDRHLRNPALFVMFFVTIATFAGTYCWFKMGETLSDSLRTFHEECRMPYHQKPEFNISALLEWVMLALVAMSPIIYPIRYSLFTTVKKPTLYTGLDWVTYADILHCIEENKRVEISSDTLPICVITRNIMTTPCRIEKLVDNHWIILGSDRYEKSVLTQWFKQNKNKIPHTGETFTAKKFRMVEEDKNFTESTDRFMKEIIEKYYPATTLTLS